MSEASGPRQGSNERICYNKGCGKRFKDKDNDDSACQYHPGQPVFHDTLKGWSCCSKKSTDFTEFLNIKGCTIGPHNGEKPPEPEKKVEKGLEIGEVIKGGSEVVPQPIQAQCTTERPPEDAPAVKLKFTVSSSLTKQLKKLVESRRSQSEEKVEKEVDEAREPRSLQFLFQRISVAIQRGNAAAVLGTIKAKYTDYYGDSGLVSIGTKCKNLGCETVYAGRASELSDCVYHCGAPIFHDGYRYWSCCLKRTSDFDEFLRQEGCTKGEHRWTGPVGSAKADHCRKDWHQTGSFVVVSFYAKACDPEQCCVKANETTLHVSLKYNDGVRAFDKTLILNGVIDPSSSSVEYLAPKVEVKLRKTDCRSWPALELKKDLPLVTPTDTQS